MLSMRDEDITVPGVVPEIFELPLGGEGPERKAA